MTYKANSLFQLDNTAFMHALEQIGVAGDASLLLQLEKFINILNKWNRVYNLTAIRDPAQMVTHHLLDSLAIQPYFDGYNVLDVGSGAGIPGIPLAIFNPDKKFTLLDSNRKKTRFIAQATIELGLKNVRVVTTRVENFLPEKTFDTVVTRAFASVDKILRLTSKLYADGGTVLLMKGLVPEQELEHLPENFELKKTLRLTVPGLTGERHIICLTHRGRN